MVSLHLILVVSCVVNDVNSHGLCSVVCLCAIDSENNKREKRIFVQKEFRRQSEGIV